MPGTRDRHQLAQGEEERRLAGVWFASQFRRHYWIQLLSLSNLLKSDLCLRTTFHCSFTATPLKFFSGYVALAQRRLVGFLDLIHVSIPLDSSGGFLARNPKGPNTKPKISGQLRAPRSFIPHLVFSHSGILSVVYTFGWVRLGTAFHAALDTSNHTAADLFISIGVSVCSCLAIH